MKKSNLLCEVKINYQTTKYKKVKIISSKSAKDLIKKLFPVDIEHREAFICIYLNRNNKTVGYTVISIGGIAGTIVDPKLVFQHGLLCNASSIIMTHNHPGGNLKPSNADKAITKKIKDLGVMMNMALLDHLIITENSYFSFADEGLIN